MCRDSLSINGFQEMSFIKEIICIILDAENNERMNCRLTDKISKTINRKRKERSVIELTNLTTVATVVFSLQ